MLAAMENARILPDSILIDPETSWQLVDFKVFMKSLLMVTKSELSRRTQLMGLVHQVVAITLGVSICTWVFVFTAMMLLAAYIPFFATIMERQVASISSLAAMLMVARSPASAVSSLQPKLKIDLIM